MAKFSSLEYSEFDKFIKLAMSRVENSKISAYDAHADVMQALTAFDMANDSGVIPYMQLVTKKWAASDA